MPESLLSEEHDNSPLWMLTMGDTMTLLLCFFVLLLTFSTQKDGHLTELESMSEGGKTFIIQSEANTVFSSISSSPQAGSPHASTDSMWNVDNVDQHPLFQFVRERLMWKGKKYRIDILQGKKSMILTVKEKDLFQDRKNFLHKNASKLLKEIGDLAKEMRTNITISVMFSVTKQCDDQEIFRQRDFALKKCQKIETILVTQHEVEKNSIGYGIGMYPPEERKKQNTWQFILQAPTSGFDFSQ